jgi:hypothetical protein
VAPLPGQPTAAPTAAQPTDQPTAAPAAAQPADQPTTAAAPAAATPETVTTVTAAPGNVTTLPTSSPATLSSAQAATAAGYTISNSTLTLEGVVLPTVTTVEGGTATGDVVSEKLGPDHIVRKHMAGLKYEDISFKAGLDSKPLTEWLAASFNGTNLRKSGSIVGMDYSYNVRSVREFTNALVTEITIPTLEATSKETAYLTVKIAPERTLLKAGSGEKGQPPVGRQKWLASNFRFEMAGLDGSKVSRIESFTISQKVVENPVGELRDYEREPAHLEIPSLKITLPQSAAQTWLDWQDDFLVKGNNGQDKERNGAIVFLDATLAKELGRVNLSNCGIFRLAPEPQNSGAAATSLHTVAGAPGRMVAEVYCEGMELQAKGTAS